MRHQVALWAGFASFFGSLLAIGAIDILNPGERAQFFGAVFVAVVTAGTIYSKQRLEDAKAEREAEKAKRLNRE